MSSYSLEVFSIWKKNWGAQWHLNKGKICRGTLCWPLAKKLPFIPETIHTQIPAAITHLLETPSEEHSRNSHFYQLGRNTEDCFYGKISTRFSSLNAADPSVVAEMKEFLPSSWTVLLLPPKRVTKGLQLSFIPGGMLFLLTVLRKINVCDSHWKCYKILLAVL